MRMLAYLAISLACLAAPASADWNDREICRAAAKVYFFTSAMPADASDANGYFGLRSSRGNVYGCRVSNGRAFFRWVNDDGRTMTSDVTTFALAGERLTVKTDLMTESFSKP